MNGDRHYSDDVLSMYVDDPASLPDRESVEEHLIECAACGEFVALLRSFEEHLQHPDIWRSGLPKTDPRDALPLVVLHEKLVRERAAAAERLAPALESPAAFAQRSVERDPELRTVGAVMVLCDASAAAREQQPAHALALADAAIVLSEALPPYEYPRLMRLAEAGNAWRERANALRYLGRYPDALEALDRAEALVRVSAVYAFDLARVNFVRATVLWKMRRFEEAMPIAEASAETFRQFGDDRRYVHVGLLQGGILFDAGRHAEARDLFARLVSLARAADDLESLGRIFTNLGSAQQELGELGAAHDNFRQALAVFEHLGMTVEKIRTRWSIAQLVLARGMVEDAITRLHTVAADFEAIGSRSDAALALLDVVETLLDQGRHDEASLIAQSLVDRFEEAGMRPSAQTAFRYLHEAIVRRSANRAVVQHVRRFLHELADDPARDFIPFAS